MAVGYNPSIVSDGLVMYLDAVNLRSYSGTGNTWYDLTTNSNHAQKINSPNYISTSGGGFTFDGNGTNYFDLDSKSSLVNANAGTVGGWVRFDSAPSGTNYVFVSYGGNAYGGGFLLIYTGLDGANRGLTFQAFGGSISPAVDSGISFAASSIYAGQDIHMIATWTTSEVKLYLNGQLKATAANNAAIPSRSTLRISSEGGRGRGVNGTVYNTSIYNRALTEQEILQNFNATRFRYGI
jgi:hypothetical protein